ncbi:MULTISPECIES: hypothetical protein [unclassified Streptomyces]|uniref:hypothetical protein n=1 Tax=unclassified Streptomyces TaxID=2593676 RepID=UPI002DDACB92|nr:hypothetical protein [Streptomyces sp. NBC_01750]WSB00748.1 hypothetical protein OIE54_16430 [Streptomyces sp. NBC_01794]WSD34895.1 hypothetical protein OG966_25180 [Streptomyces sp. NBC_01750]
MSEPNPYADGEPEYKWGPTQPPGSTPAYGYPNQAPGYGYPGGTTPDYSQTQPALPIPAAGPPAPMGGAPLVSIGDITVMGDSIVTPAGTLPLRGAVWNATDMSRTEEKIPAHAIVLAVVFFIFCLLGLLFLLMKEKTTTGFIQVTVTSGGRHHSTMIPARGPESFQMVMGQINYARSLSSM